MTLIDLREVRSLATALGKTSKEVEQEADRVLERGALGVKEAMAADAQRLTGYAKHFHRSISYDRRNGVGRMSYEIGPDKDRRQGALGNLIYFGSKNNAPQLDIEAPLIEEEPKFLSEMAKMLQRVTGGA